MAEHLHARPATRAAMRQAWRRQRRLFLVALCFTIALIIVALVTLVPHVNSTSGRDPSEAALFYAEPVHPELYREATSTDLNVLIKEERTINQSIGLDERRPWGDFNLTFAVPRSAGHPLADYDWIVYTGPRGLSHRSTTSLTLGDFGVEDREVSPWESLSPNSSFRVSPLDLQPKAKDEYVGMIIWEVVFGAPVTQARHSEQGWVQTWDFQWEPKLGASAKTLSPGFKWHSVGTATPDADPNWWQHPDQYWRLHDELTTEVNVQFCESCDIVQTYGEIKPTSSEMSGSFGPTNDSLWLEADTRWLPWWLFGKAIVWVMSTLGAAALTAVAAAAARELRLRSQPSPRGQQAPR